MQLMMQRRKRSGAAPVIPINITTVDASGWKVTYPSPPVGDFDPVGDLETVPVLRKGFNTSGVAITLFDYLALMKRVRLPYSNQLTLTTDQVAVSEFIYTDDIIAGVTNNSLLDYPEPQAVWLNHNLDTCKTSTYTARLAVAHRHARKGSPVAAVKFTATDGITTVEHLVSVQSIVSYTASGLSVPHFAGALDFSSLDVGVLITIDAIIYPWVGEAFTVSSANTYPNINLTALKVLNDYDDSYGTAHAYVDAIGGNDGTGIFHATPATAQATPYLTIAAAALDAAAHNNSTYGRNNTSGARIRLEIGTHEHGDYSAATEGIVPLIIEAANAGDKATTIYQQQAGTGSLSDSIPNQLIIDNVTIRQTTESKIVFDNGADISVNTDHMLVVKNSTYDLNGGSVYAAKFYKIGIFYNINCDGDDIGQTTKFSSNVYKSCISIGSTNGSVQDVTYHALACKDLDGEILDFAATVAKPASKRQFFGWNYIGQDTNSGVILNIQNVAVGIEGLALVGNIFEQYGGVTSPIVAISQDGSIGQLLNVNEHHNTSVGSRTNIGYSKNETFDKQISSRFNVYFERNTKSDVFDTNVLSIGNWPIINKVGHTHNYVIRSSSDGDIPDIGSWLGEFAAIGDTNGSVATPQLPAFTDDQSNQGGGAGDGDYTPLVTTDIGGIPIDLAAYSYDLYGTPLTNDGTDYLGAIVGAMVLTFNFSMFINSQYITLI